MRRRRLESKARVIARAALEGTMGPAEACRELSRYTSWIPEYFSEEEKTLIKAVDSEVDDLPVGKLANNWHPDFLPAKLAEIARYEAQVGPQVTEMCEQFLLRSRSVQREDESLDRTIEI